MPRGKRKADETEDYQSLYEIASPRYRIKSVSRSVDTGINVTSDHVSQRNGHSVESHTASVDLLQAPDTVSGPSCSKKTRKQKDLDTSAPEKRGAIFKKQCPKTILDRVERVIQQR